REPADRALQEQAAPLRDDRVHRAPHGTARRAHPVHVACSARGVDPPLREQLGGRLRLARRPRTRGVRAAGRPRRRPGYRDGRRSVAVLNKKNGYTSTGAPMNALVLIDPEIEASGTLADRLQMQGYAVSIFSDPAEGARVALGDPPCAVIADLWMPGISGVQLCRLLKAVPATESVPVILRRPESPRNRFWSERAGASDYVVKGRMGDLVRAFGKATQNRVDTGDFFTTY